MDYAELKQKTLAELKDIFASERSKLFTLRQQSRAFALKQHHLLAAHRKTIARVMKLISDAR